MMIAFLGVQLVQAADDITATDQDDFRVEQTAEHVLLILREFE